MEIGHIGLVSVDFGEIGGSRGEFFAFGNVLEAFQKESGRLQVQNGVLA